ncbi:breast cancer protein [Colletotrichum higginsianum]|uniref:Inclusion body clearance protein IML2 n=2 Tax=Colletotrichum higginsianum TaxID=80884 RepID=H1V684_COLHI|nr:Breast cancer protein [Colletotrichum higginsianum IMI 349063]OBR14844.1 Breast cancer protein [Colletotrichum higginsianum IMI 349063]TID04275.1 Mitochondrial outer membrane protein IML2 [Colletotrichum higginsianum]GJC92876.1 breast cancer protein [Colletotrichum higginsianum]CCF35736.1 breast cancer protein [Colletotrichum higginsianum]
MSRLGSWFRSSAKASSNASPASSSLNLSSKELSAKEMADIEDAMTAAAFIMNDDIDGAEERLRKGDSAFHQLGMSMTTFLRSVLGFEKEVMNEASKRLAETEAKAWADYKKAEREGHASSSRIYPPGTEFLLIHAESQLMAAVVAVLHESLTEALKGFYKLRKAFVTLDGIMLQEAKALEKDKAKADPPPLRQLMSDGKMPGSFDDQEFAGLDRNDDSDLEFVDASEVVPKSGSETPAEKKPNGPAAPETLPVQELAALDMNSGTSTPSSGDAKLAPLQVSSQMADDSDTESGVFSNPVDAFIHSGANMCFGMLLFMLSMVPPAFSRLLYVVGFRGDRDRGVRMLWKSTQFDNLNGAVSGLILLGYYNGLMGQADITPAERDFDADAEMVGYPAAKCEALLASMRTRYPESRLWRVEESRVMAQQRRLADAIQLLTTGEESKMRQVTALNCFELALAAMSHQDWELMQKTFLRCLELNDWSHTLYYYMAGCAELELYRDAFHAEKKDEEEMRRRKKKAEELFRKAPTVAGRKKFMARQLPFDTFITRKVQKWEDRAKELKVDLADAVAVSPAQEMVNLWNGTKRMNDDELNLSVKSLEWGRCTLPAEALAKVKATPDESSIRSICLAAVYRTLGRFEDARTILQTEVLNADRAAFKGPTKDEYPLPMAHYEMAAVAWFEACQPEKRAAAADEPADAEGQAKATATYRKTKTDECQEWLDKVVAWEAFVFDARLGMRVQAALETLKWFKNKNNWS